MDEVSGRTPDRREAGKFLRSPLGNYLCFRAYGGSLGKETPLRLRAGMLYHQNQQQLEYIRTVIGSNMELKPEGLHTIKRLAMPWAAPAVSPNEEMSELMKSDLMGKAVLLDKKACPFFDQPGKKRRVSKAPLQGIKDRRNRG